ncbi:MAG TPA: DUF4012 domain-containing protein [Acidimicrobiales bacterium]|nr:DUF4012 domain-containing protein [Acidimicrobiales bacterium]
MRSAGRGSSLVDAAATAAARGDGDAAAAHLEEAAREFRAGGATLDRWWVRPVARIPLAGRQVRAGRVLFRAGARVATAATTVARTANAEGVRLVGGALDTTAVRQLEPALQQAVPTLRSVHAEVSAARSGLLLPVIDRRLGGLGERVRRAIDGGETAMLGARVVPDLFGASGPRRYFVAIVTPAELRGSGGMIANFAELEAASGRLRLGRVGRAGDLNVGGDPSARKLFGPPDYVTRYGRFSPERTWQNVTMSPDFPSVAQVVTTLYPQSGGGLVDGVLSVDPAALRDLLKLTGPVTVPEWPEPLSSANAVDILLRGQYERFERDERVDFLASATRAVFGRLTAMSLPPPATVVRTLAGAVRGRHLMLFSTRPEEQRLFERMGAAGTMPALRGDFLAVVSQNAGANKVDSFLERSVTYRATVDPESGLVRSEAVVRLENRAPAGGLPAYILGPAVAGAQPGENRSYLSVYSPLELEGAVLDDRPVLMESARELQRNVYSAYVTVPSGRSVTLRLQLRGTVPSGVRYRLDVARQPTVVDDQLEVEVHVPSRPIASGRGLDVDGRVARGRLPLSADRGFELRTAG